MATLFQALGRKTKPVKKKAKVRPVETEAVDVFQKPPSVVMMIETVLDAKRVYPKWVRPSMLAGCVRQNYYHYVQAQPWHPSQYDNRMMRILDNGSAVHEIIQGYLRDHNEVFFAPETKVERVVSGLLVRGSCDGILVRRQDGYRWAIEIKTINHNDFVRLTKPKPEHILQATIYMALTKVHWVTILYWDKDKNVLKEYHVEFNPRLWKETKERIAYIAKFVRKKKVPPFVQRECNTLFCQFTKRCRMDGGKV